jgi:hypothetical protein
VKKDLTPKQLSYIVNQMKFFGRNRGECVLPYVWAQAILR